MFKVIINKVIRFKEDVAKSLFDLTFYQSLDNKSFRYSFRYLYLLILTIIFALIISVTIPLLIQGRNIPQYTDSRYKFIKDIYPEGLTLTLKDGSLRSNVDEPFYIDMPKTSYTPTDTTHLIAVDTKNTYSSLDDYHSWIIISKNNIDVVTNTNKYHTYSLKEIQGYYVINREVYLRLLDSVKPYLSYLSVFYYTALCIFIFVFPLIGSGIYFVGLIIYLLFLSYILYLIFTILRISLYTFKTIFHISLHAITASLVFQFIQFWFNISVPFTYSFPFFIWMVYILFFLTKHNNAINKTTKAN